MKWHKGDIDNWRGVWSKVIDITTRKGIEELLAVITNRVVNVAYRIINSNETAVVQWNYEKSELHFFEKISEGQIEKIGRLFIDIEKTPHIFYIEKVLIEGSTEDSEGNVYDTNLIGIKLALGKLSTWNKEGFDEMTFNDKWLVNYDEDEIISNFDIDECSSTWVEPKKEYIILE